MAIGNGITCNITQTIDRTECIGNSLTKINGNFTAIDNGMCQLTTAVGQSNTDLQLLGGSVPSIIGIRLSLSPDTPIPTTDLIGKSTLYLHPYRGNVVTLYNTSLSKWELIYIPTPFPFPLTCPLANTNYDIYLYRQNGNLAIEYSPWTNSAAGAAPPIRGYQDGTAVKLGEPGKRLIGCLRTTGVNQSEQSFGANIAGGAHPKQFLWNAQNIIPITVYSFEVGSYYALGPLPGGWTGYRRVNPTQYTVDPDPWGNANPTMIPTPNSGKNNRFSFIIGDQTLVNMTAQIYTSYYTNLTQCVSYTAIGINSGDADTDLPTVGQGSQMVSELRGSDMTPRAQLLKSFTGGYHYLQMFENIYTGGAKAVMNERHQNQTGFLASIYN